MNDVYTRPKQSIYSYQYEGCSPITRWYHGYSWKFELMVHIVLLYQTGHITREVRSLYVRGKFSYLSTKEVDPHYIIYRNHTESQYYKYVIAQPVDWWGSLGVSYDYVTSVYTLRILWRIEIHNGKKKMYLLIADYGIVVSFDAVVLWRRLVVVITIRPFSAVLIIERWRRCRSVMIFPFVWRWGLL